MSDYISKSALVEEIKKQKDDNDMHCRLCMDAMIEIIEELPTLDEKEIIRKPFERVVERLEEEARNYKDGVLQKLYFETGVAKSIQVVKEEGGIE